MKKLPFRIDRARKEHLVDQLADGLRRAILHGYYRPGDVLPNMDALAREAGVSAIVSRLAFRRLRGEGLVQSHPRIGTVVLDAKYLRRKGHVLMVETQRYDNYIISIMDGILRERLLQSGYQVSQVTVFLDPEGRPDYSLLDSLLLERHDLTTLTFDAYGVRRHLHAKGVPFMFTGDTRRPPPGCTDFISMDDTAAVPDFVAHCLARGVKHVGEVTAGASMAPCGKALRKAGIQVEKIEVSFVTVEKNGREAVERGAIATFSRLLADPGWKMPEVLFFNDDYAAVGAFLAFARYGVRVPEDVRVVSWSNRGNGPYHWKGVTRMELDPVDAGETMARYALARLSGQAIPFTTSVRPVYIVDETFP
ncbi:MAG: LacI family DNA-binding transcriptional regulator [Kiritimatiellae bacterium]|nr:LacI family DNA-binding transcriptional regulator [Kiritimatiellia bacterium]